MQATLFGDTLLGVHNKANSMQNSLLHVIYIGANQVLIKSYVALLAYLSAPSKCGLFP